MSKPQKLVTRLASGTDFAPSHRWVYDGRNSTLATFIVCTIFVFLIVPPNFNYETLFATNNADENVTNKIAEIVLLISSCFLISRRPTLWFQVLRNLNPFYLLFIALAAVSVVWSIEPTVTMHRVFRISVALLCFTSFTLAGWRPNSFQIVLRALLGVFVVGSIIFAVALPHYGVQRFLDYQGAISGSVTQGFSAAAPVVEPVLRGLTFSKNQMGQLASLGILFWFHAWLGKETKAFWAAFFCASGLICLYWSHSSTSIIATAFSLPFMLMLRNWPQWLRRYMRYILTAFTLLMLGYSLVVLKLIPQLDFLLTPITAITGKDLTFSNRTAIWQIVNANILQHPLLGAGYDAYWVDEPNSPSQEMRRLLNFYPGESHNGYLQVINSLGVAGGLCLLGFLFTYLRQALQIMAFNRHLGSLYMTLLFHQFWSSLSESHWFGSPSSSFAVISLASCTAARTLLQRRFDLLAMQSAAKPPETASPRPRLNPMPSTRPLR